MMKQQMLRHKYVQSRIIILHQHVVGHVCDHHQGVL